MFDNVVIFTQLVEIGSFSKTAEHLRIAVSTLTRKIQDLEAYFNQILLLRDTRNLELTPEGQKVYEMFKDLRSKMDSLHRDFSPTKDMKLDGSLRAVLPVGLSIKLIIPYLGYFCKLHPEAKIDIFFHNGIPDFDGENIDLAITQHDLNDPRYDYRVVRTERIKFYCTPSYAAKYGLPLTVDELANHKIIGGINENNSTNIVNPILINKHANHKIVFDHSNTSLSVNLSSHMYQIGLSGDFIFGSWSFFAEDDIRQGRLISVLPEYETFETNFILVSRKRLRPLEQAFIDFIYRCMNRSIMAEVDKQNDEMNL